LYCAVVLALTLPPARATLQQDYLDIYLKLNDSERLERNGDFRGALEGFEDCYAKLHTIHARNPDWESVLVTSRMEDCRAKIAELEPKVTEGMPLVPPVNPADAGAPPGPVATPAPGAPVNPEDEAPLRARLAEVENELAVTKQQLADVTEKYKNSQLEAQTLHAQLDSVNQQLAALKSSTSVDQNMGQLLAQNKELTDKLAAAQTEIKSLAGSPSSKAGKLVAQLKLVQEKLDESEAANAGLTETTTTLQSQLNQAQNDLAIANQKLAASGPGSPEYLTLKRENEVMRGILVREIQEQSRRDGAKRLAQEEFDRLKINSKVLQEQLDILGSPMTPPNNDDERALLTELKTDNGGVMPMGDNGNQLAATTNGAPVTEANVPAPAVAAPPTNTPPAVAADTNAAPAAPPTNSVANATPPATNAAPAPAPDTNAVANATPPATNLPPAPTNPPPPVTSADTNAPATNVAPPAPSVATTTNAAPATNPPAPASASPPTNAAPAVATDTNTPPAPPAPATNAAPVAADTNTAPAAPPTPPPAPAVATDTNTAPATNAAPADNTAATDNGASSTDQHTPDPTRYSYKPRLPDDMREVAQEATDLFKMQRYDEAAAKYQMIIDKYPESLYAWSNLGVVRSQEGKLQDAMKALQQAVKLSPNDAFSYRNLGIVYYQLNQNDAAIDALERSIALDPNNVYSHDYLGCACSQKGWQEVAEKEFRKAIEIDDSFPDAHYNLAIVYAMQKPPALELARRHYKRALELGLPKDPRLEKLLGL
jgi:cytochrome c-type biogenesis protein CcmH/NrfG